MPHQCVRCNKLYPDGSDELLKGCSCGGKFFFFVKKETLEKKEIPIHLTEKEKKQIEKDVLDIVGLDPEGDKPVILDLESIRILQPGKYELDIVELFKGKPLVYRLEDGKYIIDIASTFESIKDN